MSRFNASILLMLAVCIGSVTEPAMAGTVSDKDSVRTVYKKRAVWKEVPKNAAIPGSKTVSVTTGWRKIEGWEQGVLEKDPNLTHWSWLAMQEMNKNYQRFAPGRDPESRRRRYTKPIHIVPRKRQTTQMVSVPTRPESVYVKPVKVPFPSVTRTATSIGLRKPETRISLSAPRNNARLSAPRTNANLNAPQTSARIAVSKPDLNTDLKFAVPRTSVQIGVPKTNISLAAGQTAAALRAKSVSATIKPSAPGTGFDALPGSSGDDCFSSPEELGTNPYGVARHQTAGRSSIGYVRGKMVRKKPI